MTYRHPHTPDPWAESFPSKPARYGSMLNPRLTYIEDERPSCLIACLLIAVPGGAVAFALGYFGGMLGWF